MSHPCFKIKVYCIMVLATCCVLVGSAGAQGPVEGGTDLDPIDVLLLSGGAKDDTAYVKAEFSSYMSGFSFDTHFVNTQGVPTLAHLQQYDAVLLWTNGGFPDSLSTGNVVEQYVQAGGPLVIGTFYWQHPWGYLENIDPFTGPGCEYNNDTLDASSIVPHPLTDGLTSMSGINHGGVAAKSGTTVVARWSDGVPLIGFSSEHCIVAISHFPAHYKYGRVSGDFYQMWENALSWVAGSCVRVITVDIDIKPGSDLNPINLGSNGVIPVAIFSSSEFDATQVDPLSVLLGGAKVAVRGKGKSLAHEEDVDGDGLPDLVVQVETEADLVWEFDMVQLSGETFAGQAFEGSDFIIVMPPK